MADVQSFVSKWSDAWFIDKDDGTIITFFDGSGFLDPETGTRCPLPEIKFQQNLTAGECNDLDGGPEEDTGCPFGITSQPSFGILQDQVIPSLPDDFSFESGSVSRFDDRLSLFLEEFTPSRVGEPTTLIGLPKTSPAETYITRYDFLNVESIGTSNGSANQVFSASGTIIKLPTKGTPIVFVGTTRFSVTDDLSSAGLAAVFEYDETTGTVTFGDGENGTIPSDGEEIILKITIRNGGGIWEFIEIVEPPKSGKCIGGVKSVRDKVFYVQADNALADAAKMLEVESTIDLLKTNVSTDLGGTDNEGNPVSLTLLRSVYNHYIGFGGGFEATGGEIVAFQTTTSAYTLQTPGSASRITFEVDTATKYPNISATVPGTDGEPLVTPDFNAPTLPEQFIDDVAIESGILTTPKFYRDRVLIKPIIQVTERQNFVSIGDKITTPNLGRFLFDDPFYEISIDLLGTTTGISADRVIRLIEIGEPNPSGTFTAVTPFAPPGSVPPGTPLVNPGTFDDPVTVGRFLDQSQTTNGDGQGVGEPQHFAEVLIFQNGERYFQRVVGSSARNLDSINIKYECRQSDSDAAITAHIQGSSLAPFICHFTSVEGTETTDSVIIP